MTRNKSRTQGSELSNKVDPTISQNPFQVTETPNPFGISFVVPTEIVDIPTRGMVYGEDTSVHGHASIEIRHMTSKEEDILVNESYISRGIVLDKLLESLIVNPNIKVEDISDVDKNALIFSARATGYGNEYAVHENCENCEQETTFIYDLGKRRISSHEIDGLSACWETNLHTFILPKSELEVTIRVLTAEQYKSIETCRETRKRNNIPFNETIEFLKLAIVEVEGVNDKETLAKLVEVLPAIDSRKIRYVHGRVVPFLDTRQAVTCGGCNQEVEREVPFSLGFFWPDF